MLQFHWMRVVSDLMRLKWWVQLPGWAMVQRAGEGDVDGDGSWEMEMGDLRVRLAGDAW
jgi:hypothetical protein